MKKILLILGLVSLSTKLLAASATAIIPANTMTNFVLLSQAPVKVISLSANTFTTNSAIIFAYDTPTNATVYTNAGYTNILSYVTNYITTYTNYYGYTNNLTNKALVDVTNSVAITTNNLYPLRYSASIGTNATVLTDQLNAVFNQGLWITNQSVGAVAVTVTYQQ